MADHRDDLVVDELLRNLRGLPRVGRVVLRVELQRDFLAADRETLGVDLFNRETCAVFVVLAQVCNAAAHQGRDVADLDDLIGRCVARSCSASIAAAVIGNSFCILIFM